MLHKYDTPVLAANVLPWHIVTLPEGVISAIGNGFIVAVTGGELATQPLASVTVTV